MSSFIQWYSTVCWKGCDLLIELINVSKKFGDGFKALRNVSLKINNGEFVFLVGQSGAGKSTLIKLLLKEISADSGSIIINNKDISKLKRKEIPYLRRSIGVVFQDFRLLQDKTVYENVAFAMEVIEAPARDIRRKVPIVLSLVGLAKVGLLSTPAFQVNIKGISVVAMVMDPPF